MSEGDKGDFKDKQFGEGEVADKVVEQCEWFLAAFLVGFEFYRTLTNDFRQTTRNMPVFSTSM
jgi:hypothetical protein